MAIAEAPALASKREPVAVPVRETLVRRISRHWADYLYVLPALLVMLVVIGYPLVYTVWLSFHATPPRTGEWVFNGVAELPGHPERSALLADHEEHDLLDDRIDVVRLHPRLRRGACAYTIHSAGAAWCGLCF